MPCSKYGLLQCKGKFLPRQSLKRQGEPSSNQFKRSEGLSERLIVKSLNQEFTATSERLRVNGLNGVSSMIHIYKKV